MAKEMQPDPAGLDTITAAAKHAAVKGPPPVHLWNPPFCGDLDMRIATDGTWFYLGTPIGRPALVKLFASVLKREGDKLLSGDAGGEVRDQVDDAPFLAVEMNVQRTDAGPVLHFRTNVDDWVACGPEHALRFEPETGTGGLKPYLHVRRGPVGQGDAGARSMTWSSSARNATSTAIRMFGVASHGEFFAMAPADSLREFA